MDMPEEFTVPQAASYLNVSQETVRRNIRSRRLKALRSGPSGSYRATFSSSLQTATILRLASYARCCRRPSQGKGRL